MDRFRAWHAYFFFTGLLVLWFMLGVVPLNERSEGRYGMVSLYMAGMLEGAPRVDASGRAIEAHDSAFSRVLVPMYFDPGNPEVLHPHLTKPPLTYWLQSALIRLFGANAWAIRIPSAAASTLVLLLTCWFARKTRGMTFGCASVAALATMPVFVIVSRLGLTDALLALGWWGTLVFGFLSVTDRPAAWPHGRGDPEFRGGARWLVPMWASVAWSLLTKGPVGWLPVGVLLLWLALAGRARDIRRLRLVPGLIASALPLAAWVALVAWHNPYAIGVWYSEMVNRAVGSGDHPEPIWFFVMYFPVLFAPATLALNLPWVHYRAAEAWRRLRSRDDTGMTLWALAVIVPFIIFTLVKGKLLSYMLPLGPPMALLTGHVLTRWIEAGLGVAGAEPEPVPGSGVRWPEIRRRGLVSGVVLGVGAVIGAGVWLGARYAWLGLPALPLAFTSVYTASVWRRRPELRGRALALGFTAIAIAWLGLLFGHAHLYERLGAPATLAKINEVTHGHKPSAIVTLGYTDPTMTFYDRRVVASVRAEELPALVKKHHQGLTVVTDEEDWENVRGACPEIASLFTEAARLPLWPRKPTRLILVPSASAAVTR